MGKTNQDLELVQIREDIISMNSDDVRNKFAIGEKLARARDITKYDASSKEAKKGQTEFDLLIDDLPFGKVVATKFIAIYECSFLRDLANDNQAVGNLPTGYNNLYAYTHKDIVSDADKVAKLTDLFTKGKTSSGENTNECSASKLIADITKSPDDEVVEVMKSLTSLKVKESAIKCNGSYEHMSDTYSNFLTLKSLITKIKKEVMKVDFVTFDFDKDKMSKLETIATKISKENTSLYGSSKLDQIKNDVEVESMKDVA